MLPSDGVEGSSADLGSLAIMSLDYIDICDLRIANQFRMIEQEAALSHIDAITVNPKLRFVSPCLK